MAAFSPTSIQRYGSTALVTGASSGIGETFARRLAAEGFTKLVLVARREDRLRSLQEELQNKYSCSCAVVACDLADPGAAENVMQQLVALGIPEVDVVVNNAGFGLLGTLESLPKEKVSAMVDLNCRAVVEIARFFLPGMKQRQRGAMIITSSVVGTVPAPWFSVYAATKAFDLYLGESLYGECKGSGVDVLTVLPGLTRTEFHAGLGEREYHSPYRTPEQVVQTALKALGKKPIVVDGALNKLMVHGSRFLPRGLALWLSHRVMKFELGM